MNIRITKKVVAWTLVIYAATALVYFLPTWCAMSEQNAGLFGDSFGAFNAFFSGLAFLGVVAALVLQIEAMGQQQKQLDLQGEEIQLQRDELKTQREELKLSREELARAASAQEAQQQALGAQVTHMGRSFRMTLCNQLLPVFDHQKQACLQQSPQDMSGFEKYKGLARKCRQELETIFGETWATEVDTNKQDPGA